MCWMTPSAPYRFFPRAPSTPHSLPNFYLMAPSAPSKMLSAMSLNTYFSAKIGTLPPDDNFSREKIPPFHHTPYTPTITTISPIHTPYPLYSLSLPPLFTPSLPLLLIPTPNLNHTREVGTC